MKLAIDTALEGIKNGCGPFGAVITTFGGRLLSVSANSVVQAPDPTRHAEMNAISLAAGALGMKRKNQSAPVFLSDTVLYTTTEPCLMCRGGIYWARIPIIIYGTSQKDARVLGFDEINISDKHYQKLGQREIVIVNDFMREEAKVIFEQYRKMHGTMY